MPDICKCWDDLTRLGVGTDLLATELSGRRWKEARERLPTVKERVETLEKCSGIGLGRVRSGLSEIEEQMGRHEWLGAWIDSMALKNELVWDLAKCPRRQYYHR